MDKIIKNILQKIENAGFEAYLVGGFVRDYLLGIKSLDVDICTNALPKDLIKIFPNNNNTNNYGGVNLQIKKYNIDITTFRKELKYNNRRPTEIVYINDLKEDIKRRDFTINAICMNKDEKIIDLLNGIDDLTNRQIKIIGNIEEKITEDPLRILRAIRFASVLDFEIENNLYKAIKKNYTLVSKLSVTRIKQELNKILLHKNFYKGLTILKNTKILELLEIDYDDIVYVNDICGMWAQLKTTKNYAFTKQENRNIISIRQIIKNDVITEEILYEYGLYNSLVAADILNINRNIINKMYHKLPIKNIDELDITNEEILEVLSIKPSHKLKEIQSNIVKQILNGNLKNKNKEIKKYLLKNYT